MNFSDADLERFRWNDWARHEMAPHAMAHLWDNVALWTALMVHYQEHWGPTEDAGEETDWSRTAEHVWPRPA